MDPGRTDPSWRSGNTHGFCVTGGVPPIASEPTPSPRLWAASPDATPVKLCEYYYEGFSIPFKLGTFYLAGNRNFLLGSDTDLTGMIQVVRGSSEGQCRCFSGWRVQLPKGQHTAISNKLRRLGSLSQQRGKRGRSRPCGQVLVRGMVGRSRLGNGHFSHREAISPVRTQISCGNCAPTRILIIALEEGRES